MNTTWIWFMYGFFVLGGAGLYLLMPRSGPRTTWAGVIVGLGGLSGLLAMMAQWVVPHAYNWVFYPCALVAIAAGARVVTHPKPVYSAVYFVLVVLAVAMILIIQLAEFLAVALVIIYAGAILVTYVFVIMLAQQPARAGYDVRAREPLGAILASCLLAAAVTSQLGTMQQETGDTTNAATLASAVTADHPSVLGHTEGVGVSMLTRYVVSLELAGVLLLVAMVGSITLARRRAPSEPAEAREIPLGEVGKRVKPF